MVTSAASLPRRRSGARRVRIGHTAKLYTSLAVCAVLAFTTLFPGVLAHQDPLQQALVDRLRPPVWNAGGTPAHVLGTDSLGRDVLARIVYGTRFSVPIAVSAVAAAGIFGTLLGIVAGYFGGPADLVVIALADFMLSFPFILTALLVAAVLGAGVLNLVLVLAVGTWPTYARIGRAEATSLRHQEFMTAARAVGLRTPTILRRHLLPNISGSLIVIASRRGSAASHRRNPS